MITQQFVQLYHRLQTLPHAYRITVKCLISVLLLWSVLNAISIEDLRASFSTVLLFPLVAALVLKYVNMLIMTGKWLTVLPEHPRFSSLLSLYWAADFMGLFFFGFLGTELFKGIVAQRKAQVVASSLFDRGLALMLYSVVCGIIGSAYFIQPLGLKLLGIVASIGVYIVLLVFLIRGASALAVWYGKRMTLSPLLQHGLLSTCSILVTSGSQWAIFYSLGVTPSWSLILIFSVILIIALALPITIQGIGVREWVYITAAPLLLLSPAAALTAAWLHYILDVLYKSSGALPYLTQRHRL